MSPQEDIKSFQACYGYNAELRKNGTDSITAEGSTMNIIWRNVIGCVFMHLGALYGLYLFMFKVMWMTVFYTCFLDIFCGLSVTAGAHRLWGHKSYKARLPLQIILLFFNTMCFQFSVWRWVREHRTHHKYSDTDADPHNSKRGFLFSHIGWLLVKKHPDLKAGYKTIDMSDIENDPILEFQKRHYLKLALLTCFIIPTYIATLWGESIWNALFVCGIFRPIFIFHKAALINSAAHMWGMKPYDKHIAPVDNKILSWIASGEGFHNFHHAFPWDYKTAELGGYSFNITKLFIDIMAAIGWAHDLKTVSPDVIQKRMDRTGDGRLHTTKQCNFES